MSANPHEPSDTAPSPVANAAPTASNSVIVRVADGLVLFIARHWLAMFTIAWTIYLVLPFLAPIFVQIGWTAPAQVIYSIYSFTCHQLPDHSYFLFGPTPTPDEAQLVAAGMSASPNLFLQREFIGNESIGFKVALCQRDVAIYAGVVVASLLFALLRPNVRRLPFKIYLLLLLPIAIDGGSQLIGLRESNWLLRTLTGALFGAASVWIAYPYIDDAMQDVIRTESTRKSAGA